ncbi:MAG: hypothetical protein QOI80_3273 [Solirubrobacteraceae bacterium]|nr:hypothetical protein [Solirubrobacteraceae bacterium]
MRRAALAGLLAALVCCSVARADGDPASDVLLTQDSFLPYAPPTQAKLKTALVKVLRDAKAAGFPMKVALIASEADLGAYPQLFNKPQQYADLLTRELASLNPHGDPLKAVHLLVVMPGGYGGSNLGDDVDAALAPVEIQADAGSDGLARAAIAAVARLATANGHRLAIPPEASVKLGKASATKKGGGTSPLVFLAPALLLFGGLFVAGRVSARRGRDVT